MKSYESNLVSAAAVVPLVASYAIYTFGWITPILAATVACSLTAIASIIVGHYWLRQLLSNNIDPGLNIQSTDELIDSTLRTNLPWLQAARPVTKSLRATTASNARELAEHIATKFYVAYLLAIGVSLLGLLALLAIDKQSASEGMFGSLLLDNRLSGLVAAAITYIALSALSFFICGWLAKLRGLQ